MLCAHRPRAVGTTAPIENLRWLAVCLLALTGFSFLVGCAGQTPQQKTATESTRSPTPAVSLHQATLTGDLAVIRQHLQAGTDLNETDAYGSAPLIIAATFGQTEAARLLLEAGADTETVNKQRGTPLHTAAFLGRTEIVNLLLQQGADRYAKNDTGSTPYDIVATSFERDLPIYHQLSAGLAPLGLTLDLDRIRSARLQIAARLRPDTNQLEETQFAPQERADWTVSTPQAEGLPAELVAELFYDAAQHETLESLLLIKRGKLVAEGYFNRGQIDRKVRLASVTKSVVSASVGLALQQGCLPNIEQKMLDYFPEFAGAIQDPRKQQITIRHLLQMRGGYPWEETDPVLWNAMLTGRQVPLLVDYPLVDAPGSGFNYSNISSHLLGVILARACNTDLRSFAQNNLFDPIDAEAGEWTRDLNGNFIGMGTLHLSARETARFGLTYLQTGRFAGRQLIDADWVKASLQNYSEDTWIVDKGMNHVGRYFDELGYGYQWWSASVNDLRFDFAWGHGGQLVVLLPQHEMVIVTTSYPFHMEHNPRSWRHERSVFNLIGKFISLLPDEEG